MAVNDVYRVRVVSVCGNQIGVNVMHYYISAIGGTGSSQSAVATALDTAFAAPMKAVMSAESSYRGVGVQKIFPLPPVVENTTIASAGAGGIAGDVLPLQVSGIIRKRTSYAGKAYRGRFYIPFPGESTSDTLGVPNAGYLANLNALGLVFNTVRVIGAGGNTWTLAPCIWHRTTNTFTLIQSCTGVQAWATQRRRGAFGQYNTVPF